MKLFVAVAYNRIQRDSMVLFVRIEKKHCSNTWFVVLTTPFRARATRRPVTTKSVLNVAKDGVECLQVKAQGFRSSTNLSGIAGG